MSSPLPWHKRSIGIPQMPGNLDEAQKNLRSLLLLVDQQGNDLDAVIEWPLATQTSLRAAVNRIGTCGLVRRPERDKVELTADARAWLADGRPETLVRLLHCNVQFVGELLHEIAESADGLTHEELRSRAVQIYRGPWNSLDPIRKRTSWLRSTGMLYLRFDNRLVLTDDGVGLLRAIRIANADDINGPGSTESDPGRLISPPTGAIATELDALDASRLRNRSFGFGYLPRPIGSTIPATVRELVQIIRKDGDRSRFIEASAAKYCLTEQSAPRVLSMLITTGLVSQTSATSYSVTSLAEAWLASGSDIDLVRIFHLRIAVVGELLEAIRFYDKAPALSRYAVEKYGFRHDVDGVRVRLHLLTAAGLLQEYGLGRFRITPLGEAFQAGLPVLDSGDVTDSDTDSGGVNYTPSSAVSTPPTDQRTYAEDLATELLVSGLDSDNPERLELAVRDAFRYLGFEAEQLGGSGRTDVIVSFSDSPGQTTIVSVDAKSSGNGVVSEGSVNFDTIEEHKKHHEATFACLVGPTFHASRLPGRAKARRVAILETELLATAVRRQAELALSTVEIASVFDSDRSPGTVLSEAWQRAERRNRVLTSVIAALGKEAETPDEVTKGALSLDNIYFLLRNDLEVKPDPEIISQAVALLASPLVASISSTSKNVYVATEKPATIARKLHALALAAQSAADLLEN